MSGLTPSLAPIESVIAATDTSAPAISPSWGVVSFLLEDAVWCDWLYREFDGQRVPRRLISKPTRFGTSYPERISISPDPADPSELETYAESLQSAQHLILVISPASGNSPTIEEHMRIFNAAGGAERVIALIVKGEPASPAAEPASPDDQKWLPDWLRSRFENNRFHDGGASEPLVIDARMGVASLAEARAAIMAALLEIDRAALNEFGGVTRPTTALMDFPSQANLHNVPPPTPSNIAFLEIAAEIPIPRRQSTVTLWVCGFAALVSLAVLGLWPTQAMHGGQKLRLPSATQPESPAVSSDLPLVEARPILDTPLSFEPKLEPEAAPAAAAVAVPSVAPQPQILPAEETLALPSSSRVEHAALRDRFTRLAESRMAEGNGNDALEILDHATEAGAEVLLQPDATPADFVNLSMLHRRAGTLAEGLSQAAEARKHYESGRRVLMDLQSRESLSKEGMHMLVDLDSRLRQLR